ncbi:protein still life, isoforms C/SIF type 2-like, partial [Musca vetustissima]|uniref:protein still life, isoforms C/SIF type 2-like n=1 Tax=Musca vetustissima TaxID=27455 RepID=UPI002AB6C35E
MIRRSPRINPSVAESNNNAPLEQTVTTPRSTHSIEITNTINGTNGTTSGSNNHTPSFASASSQVQSQGLPRNTTSSNSVMSSNDSSANAFSQVQQNIVLTDVQFQQILSGISINQEKKTTFTGCTARFSGGRNSTKVEDFIATIEVYKEAENISESSALNSFPLLLEGYASTWWQGVQDEARSFKDAIELLRNAFAPVKPDWRIFNDICQEKQKTFETTDAFVCRKRRLFAQLSEKLSEKTMIDMLFGQLNSQIRGAISRTSVKTFQELLQQAREIEMNISENRQENKDEKSKLPQSNEKSFLRCTYCRKKNHLAENCFKKIEAEKHKKVKANESKLNCYGCGMEGYYRSNCPNCNMKNEQEKPLDFNSLHTTMVGSDVPLVDINVYALKGEAYFDTAARTTKPLSDLTKKNAAWHWGEKQQNAFDMLKKLLTSPPILQQVDENMPFILKTDASNYALGAVLIQGEKEFERTIEYASRLLLPAEKNYSTTEREALAIVWAVDKFRGYIEGSEVLVKTDHQPLKWLFSLKSPTGRLARWALLLQSFNIKIEYTPGRQNHVADTLSRPPCSHHTTSDVKLYHPEANPVERKNRDLKVQLSICVGQDHTSWDLNLSSIRFAMNTSKCSTTGYSAAYLTFGRELRSPCEVQNDLRAIVTAENFVPQITPHLLRLADALKIAKESEERMQDRNKLYADLKRLPQKEIKVGDKVLISTHIISNKGSNLTSKFVPRRDGPYIVVDKQGAACYTIATMDNIHKPLGKYHASDLTIYEGKEMIPLYSKTRQQRSEFPTTQNLKTTDNINVPITSTCDEATTSKQHNKNIDATSAENATTDIDSMKQQSSHNKADLRNQQHQHQPPSHSQQSEAQEKSRDYQPSNPLILAASHSSDKSDNNNSVSGSGYDKKSFSLHCCCVIVDITPVSQAGRLTSATTASGRDVTAGSGGGGGGSVLGDGVSQLASSLFRFGSSKKRPVCICNAQCRLQPFGEATLGPTIKTHHGSLDRLLQQQQQQDDGVQQKLYSTARTIGGVVGEGGKDALSLAADSDNDMLDTEKSEKPSKESKSAAAAAAAPPPRPPSRGKFNVQQVKEEFDKGVEVEKFYHQINGDIFEITRRVRARSNEDTIEQKLIKSRDPQKRIPPALPPKKGSGEASHIHTHSHKHVHHRHANVSAATAAAANVVSSEEQKPQLPPRRQKSAEEVPVSKEATIKPSPDDLEWFDRKAQQRHSSRSAESGTVRDETIEWLERQRIPARTSSGPSEITVMKDEIPEWLLEHLPRKRSGAIERQQTPQQADSRPSTSSYAKALKEELAELLKKPLSRQSSGPGEISLLKSDLVEWLTKSTKALTSRDESSAPVAAAAAVATPKPRRSHHRRNGSGDTPRSHSHEDDVSSQHASRKRHSLGYSERSEESIPDWIAYPLSRLQSLGKTPVDRRASHQSFIELPQKSSVPPTQTISHTQQQQQQQICSDRRYQEQRIKERRLRHSASEVVTVSTPTPATPSNVERLYAKPHKERYQYIPKDELIPPQLPPKMSKSRESKRERSRRHQTQRSATISDMSASHNGLLKRKSSSAERAPRSPSPCTDPLCPLLPICTDPNCRYLECQPLGQRKQPSTTSSTLNLLRNQQLTKAQMHTVPPSDDGAATAGGPPTLSTAQPSSSASQKVPPAQSQPKRKFVICHDCRYCAPLSCRNRKCLNAPKCNSLPRCAADFNRLRTTLTQPPASLYDTDLAATAATMQIAQLDEQMTTAMAATSCIGAVQPSSAIALAGPRSSSQPNTLQRGESCALLYTQPVVAKRKHQNGHAIISGSNGKLIKSASAVSLDERRRRHKTVHFGENLLREVCQNRKLIKYEQQKPSGSQPSQTNGELLYNFVEGVLSAWHDDDDEDQLRSGAESEPEHGTMALKPLHRYDVVRYQVIKRVVNEAAELHGTLHLGNSRFRHRHWRSTAKQCNELFLRKISDDDRMSLTTAVSDEDDGESVMASPYKAKATGTAASSFNCTGAVRKAGFLSVKKWLLRKKHQIELARKRGWKGYWVCLKGTTLLFYPCDSREGRSVEAAPKHLIIVDGAIMQPIPEHPKRDYIFCLSTAFGDAYLFQAPCQVELENWVNSIHSACAAAFARHRGKTGTLHLLQEEIFRIEKAIESDHKLKHMAELQQSVVTDQDTRLQIQGQILQWEENLERLHCEQFRLRCYMASLQSGELPNPKSLLTHVSRPTKNTLNKLGVFTVSSFHAFICARSPSLLNNLLAGRGATKRRPPMLSRSNSGSSRRSMQLNSRDEPEKTFKVAMPDNAYSTVYLRDAMSVEEFLASACARRNLNPMEHFVRVKKRRDMEDHNYFVPHRNDLIENYLHNHEFVEVCMKILYQVELHRTTLEQMWGFSVEAELIENAERQDELCCYVSRVEDKSVAMQNGIIKGDEIMVINGAIVSDLDMMYLESVLQEEQSLSMMMRSSRTEPPDLGSIMRVTDDMIESLVCPPPPTDPPVMSEEMITGLIVPAPGWNGTGKDLYSPEAESSPAPSFVDPPVTGLVPGAGTKPTSRTSSFEIENLLKTAEQ